MRHDALHNFGTIDFSVTNMSGAASTVLAFPSVLAADALGSFGAGEPLFVELESDADDPPTVATPGTDYYVMNVALAMTSASTQAAIGTAAGLGQVEVIGRSGEYAAVGSKADIGGLDDFSVATLAASRKILIPVPPLPRDVVLAAAKDNLAVILSQWLSTITAISVGKLHARLVLSGQLDYIYPSGYSVT